MKALYKGLVLAAIHVAIVSSLGAKLLYDRAARPRVWAQAAPYDPDLPIRGRYVRIFVQVEPSGIEPPADKERQWTRTPVALSVEDRRLVARADTGPSRETWDSGNQVRFLTRGEEEIAVLDAPLAFFIPEHVQDPSRRGPGEELWVEVTIPKKGPPRPIRLGVRKDGVLTPLDLR
jgi:hypothetical protein